ncbi:putative 2,4-dihydroxyhept-2-ene-1,7-dioic acid aldolase protein [Candidatus Moduliflexus flocculans]|uniref:Putative 2,4-dihydroxyhept-2-ene-1,7-dioic acid aldolase protein n=1 Tax=Candidatus Moduliflexus flocculans TaxID=1499966 RepID=A0A081BLK6_9BACT|nr:putative 2,4-dihydroxyhept-2-ene-1,7-dioic acid aldolase protein [Candidatus Moduliflexus flocculans]
MEHQFRAQLRRKEVLVGMVTTLSSPEIAEMLAAAGYDWLFVDGEHGPFGTLELQRVMQAAGRDMPCVVRIPIGEEWMIKQALDSGAAGILVPMVNSAEQAAQIVRWAKYPPMGTRGVGAARAHRYGLAFQEYVDSANDEIAVIVQAEHIEAVHHIEQIVEVAGIDAVFVGPYDLSASLGRTGDVTHPEVIAAIAQITAVCQRKGMPLGIFGANAAILRPYIQQGYTLIAASTDTMVFTAAVCNMLAEVRETKEC